jgi:spore maturation protein CgeB
LKEVVAFTLKSSRYQLTGCNKQGITNFDEAERVHQQGLILKLFRKLLIVTCTLVWGRKRGPRAARRLVFEMSRRLLGLKTFTASGLPGRMFPEL